MDNFVAVGMDLGLWVSTGLLVLFGVLSAVAWRMYRKAKKAVKAAVEGDASWNSLYDLKDNRDGWQILSVVFTVCAGLVVLFTLIFAFPFQSRYVTLYRTTTTVESVSNNFVDGNGQLVASPVVKFAAIDTPVVVDDARFVKMEGREVTITCQPVWHYQAADTYICSLYSVGE